MNNNWFRNEAKVMFVIFILPFLLALFALLYLNYIKTPIVYEAISAEEETVSDFQIGYSASQISSNEMFITRAYSNIKILECENFENKEIRINGERAFISAMLLSTFINKNIIPEDYQFSQQMKDLIIPYSEHKKDSYLEIKNDRKDNGWTDENPEIEKKINEVLDLYIEYGNPYKLK